MTTYMIKYLLYFIICITSVSNSNSFIVRSSSYGNLNLLQQKDIKPLNENKMLLNKHKNRVKLFKNTDGYKEIKNILIDIKNINKIYFSQKNNKLLIIYNNNTRNTYYIDDDNIKFVLGNSIYSSFIYIFKEFINEYIHYIFTSLYH